MPWITSESDTEKIRFLHAVRGSPATLLLAMILFPNLHGEGRLAQVSGMNRTTVHRCLYALEGLGFVYRGGRYEGWILGPGIRQMVLGEGANNIIEGDNFTFPSSSGSSVCIEVKVDHEESETTTTGDGEKTTFADELGASWTLLTGMGCSPAAATAALIEAGERGDSCGEIERRLEGWMAYCSSNRGKSIQAPGFLAARRVEQGMDAPVLVEESRDEKASKFVLEVLGRRAQEGGAVGGYDEEEGWEGEDCVCRSGRGVCAPG